ncbi:MAG: hypothetical protein ABWZ40_02410 [Caulobacterales bacterium]
MFGASRRSCYKTVIRQQAGGRFSMPITHYLLFEKTRVLRVFLGLKFFSPVVRWIEIGLWLSINFVKKMSHFDLSAPSQNE